MELQKPTTQTEEVLYFLLTKHSINVSQMMRECGILNLTARIADLRNKHLLNIPCMKVETQNKFKRGITYGVWKLPDKKRGIKIYKQLQNQSKKTTKKTTTSCQQ